MKKYLSWQIGAILIFTLFLTFFDIPGSTQSTILPLTPEAMTDQKVHLGLDLQGGSQLDYKVDLRKVPESDQESIVDGVRSVIEKRVNALGVSEANIYVSNIAEETHIIVELAETAVNSQEDVDTYLSPDKDLANLTDDEKKYISLEKAKATVGKTIQLEFKEQKKTMDPQEKEKVKEMADASLAKINAGSDYDILGQEEQQAYPGKVTFDKKEFTFASDIPEESIRTALEGLAIGEHSKELIETGGAYTMDSSGSGQLVENTGLSIVKLLNTKEEVKNAKEVNVSHILISWAGLETADAATTRTEEEAYTRAQEVLTKLNAEEPATFADLAKEYSEDDSNAADGGKLSDPVTGAGTYVYDFEQAALALETPGQVSDIVKTQFGYHIIKADEVKTDVKEKQYQYETITYSTVPDPWKETGLTGEHFVHADVQLDNFYQPYVTIQFNDDGAKLFEEITGRNLQKPVAIFVGGQLISSPTVQSKISGGSAQITGQFTSEEANNLARDLNTGAIPAPIILTGEYTIGATLGHEALSMSLKAGSIGLLLVMIFMLFFYRIPGLVACFSLISYASILIFLIKSQLHLVIALGISLVVFLFLIMKIVNNKDSGWEKFLSFILSCVAFFFLTFLLKTPVVLTLAGVAGIILSIGMAVDANILIFERVKEELREGKTLKTSVEVGFDRAWSAIRDSNFSTLLTCAILFYFGSSIIRGFAFNLAAGILVSMFTAITITRALLNGFIGRKIAQNLSAFGVSKKTKVANYDYIGKSKIWLGISATLVLISLIAIFSIGLNLGLDFTGGSLMEIKFTEPVTKETLATTLTEVEGKLNVGIQAETATPTEPLAGETVISETQSSIIDLTNIQILKSEENSYIIKTKYLTSDTHDQILDELALTLPEFTESRFTTIGPSIGKTLLSKAVTAIIITLIMIILYIAVAFRKITRQVSSWKFGAAAIAALLHDVIIVTGFFVILSKFFNVEIDALFITALLTVFGYSVNDTIVVFDRLRDNLIRSKSSSLEDNANRALNETMTRSLNTSFSTLITLVAVLLMGSSSIFYFILALTAGIVIGTYSSIFTASPLLVLWSKIADKK